MEGSGAPRVVVFTMGKSGSTAIAHALESRLGTRPFQVFRLEPGGLAAATARYRTRHPAGEGHGLRRRFPGALHLWESEFLQTHRPSADAPWVVCTTVREPVAQAVSAYFHGAEHGHRVIDSDPLEVARAIVDDGWLRRSVRWFEREFVPALAIDVYATPFPHRQGWVVLTSPAARVALVRQENLDAAPLALQTLLDSADPVPVGAHNVGATKPYADAYTQFLDAACFPADALEWAYSSRYARHFYTAAERAAFLRRWSTPVDAR
jgi:hypothetical protein